MGFLDLFDRPDIMSTLLGIDGGASYDPSQAPRSPGPDIGAPMANGLDPRMGNVTNPPMPQPRPYIPGDPTARPDILASSGDPRLSPPYAPPAAMARPDILANSGDPRLSPPVPMPMARPQNPAENEALAWGNPGAGPGAPLDISANGPGGPNAPGPGTTLSARAGEPPMAPMPPPASGELAMNPQQPLQQPMAAAPPPMPPPVAMANGPAPTTAGGGLAAAFGLDPNNLRATLHGVGKGLSAVGAQPRGASPGQAFAAGAGGALSATTDMQEKQKQQHFANSSTAFKDVMAANESEDKQAINSARARYFNTMATSMAAGGGKNGSSAWQNTPYGKVIQVENEAQKYEKGQQILLQKRWSLNGTSPEQQQADLDNLQKQSTAYRQRLYRSAGIDPSKAETLKDMGTSSKNPFDTKGMTVEQFHAQVPMGAWFKDQNGVVRQRTVPPPGYNAGPQSSGGGAMPSAPGVSGATYEALQPAA